MKKIIAFILTLIFAPLFCFALNMPKDYPKQLIYKGKPISPLVFCLLDSETPPKPEDADPDMIRAGYVGSSYRLTSDDGEVFHGETYYQVIGHAYNYFIVNSTCNNGGTSSPNTLYQVTPVTHGFDIQAFNSGDRYDGGLLDAKQEGNQFFYTVSLTTDAFFAMTHLDPNRFKVNNLATCEACTFAGATFSRSLGQQLGDEKLAAITFKSGSDRLPENPIDTIEDTCFRDVVSMYRSHDDILLKPDDLNTFAWHVNMCHALQPVLGIRLTRLLMGTAKDNYWAPADIVSSAGN